MPHALWLFSTAYRDVVATVLTVLTALTLMARFSTAELILIVRVPARPSRLNDISMPIMRGEFARDAAGRRGRRDVLAGPRFFSRYRH
jgi:hypothetical protein